MVRLLCGRAGLRGCTRGYSFEAKEFRPEARGRDVSVGAGDPGA